jgi:sensor histidine kinase YesM
MTFNLFGIEWDLIALTVFMFVWMVSTQLFKPLLKKVVIFEKWMKSTDIFNLLLSWMVAGLTYFFIIHKLLKFEITSISIVQFSFFTLLVNGGYKVVTKLYKYIKEIKQLEKDKRD